MVRSVQYIEGDGCLAGILLSRVPGRRRSLHSVGSQRFHLPHYALASARDAPREDRAAIWARLATEHVDDLSGSSRNLGLPACCSANRSADKCLVEGLMRDFGVERKPLHSPKGADVEKYTPYRGRCRAASMHLLIEVIWINSVLRRCM